jgi:hypothetical protein
MSILMNRTNLVPSVQPGRVVNVSFPPAHVHNRICIVLESNSGSYTFSHAHEFEIYKMVVPCGLPNHLERPIRVQPSYAKMVTCK